MIYTRTRSPEPSLLTIDYFKGTAMCSPMYKTRPTVSLKADVNSYQLPSLILLVFCNNLGPTTSKIEIYAQLPHKMKPYLITDLQGQKGLQQPNPVKQGSLKKFYQWPKLGLVTRYPNRLRPTYFYRFNFILNYNIRIGNRKPQIRLSLTQNYVMLHLAYCLSVETTSLPSFLHLQLPL